MSTEYRAAVQHEDSIVALIWDAAKKTFGADLTFIVTADHGGDGFGHADGPTNPLSRTIPWVAWGNGVKVQELTASIHNMDTGPTVLWLLGIDPPSGWDGVPVKSAFSVRN